MAGIEEKGAYETTMGMPDVHPVSTANPVGYVGDLHEAGTKRTLKSRHAQMIAIGGTIGTGLFVGSGQALRMGNPFFLVLSYVIISTMIYGVVTATTEMSSYLRHQLLRHGPLLGSDTATSPSQRDCSIQSP
ncbi:hypothetical protein BU25DRAFT_467379 [Macroventuria anomochaeta]|uniref:Uncharacterized protein n=1 Tax=Macroventuria anomochaeta TaxID=301207 RepID=A0ACB6S3X8_9PLEO|nr:uncharacterized protein BU25DRAFT_467379 [Macroventuria anomochaeta]KAF2628073.1 hypothetical protein BU25DRAFT_467379 [Macroventuria anomochaeta]